MMMMMMMIQVVPDIQVLSVIPVIPDIPGIPVVLGSVVRNMDALSIKLISIQWMAELVFLTIIHWIVIYPVDSAIQLLNNKGMAIKIIPIITVITVGTK